MSVLVGKNAPDFTTQAVLSDNTIVDDYNFNAAREGKYGVVFFYPLDFTFVCPSELIAMDNRMEALTSVIFGLMIVSFPLGAYAIFNSDIGDDIDYSFPLEKFDIFIAGVNIQLPMEYEIGDAFVIFWAIFIILFVITFLGPKKNFIKTIGDILSNEKNSLNDNYMLNIIKWFSILVLISAVITIIQESFGIITEPPDTANDLILFLQISVAPITEEIGFRLVLIGIPLFLIYSHKSSIKFFFKSLWAPHSTLHIYENKKAIAIIVIVGIFFGVAHVISGLA